MATKIEMYNMFNQFEYAELEIQNQSKRELIFPGARVGVWSKFYHLLELKSITPDERRESIKGEAKTGKMEPPTIHWPKTSECTGPHPINRASSSVNFPVT